MNMEIRLLRYFWTIAEEGTISRAAEVLHITQPTLSRQLKSLEEQLGTPLFVRDTRQMQLTEAGMFLKSRAAEILSLNDATEHELEARQQQLFSGNIAIGCVEAANSETLAGMLTKFIQQYPHVTFHLYDGTSADIHDRLNKGLLDVAVVLEPAELQHYEKLQLPQTERWGVAIGADQPLAQHTAITPTELGTLPLVMGQRAELQQLLTDWIGRPLDELNIVGSMNLGFNTIPLIAAGVVATLSIEGAVRAYHNPRVRFVPLAPQLTTNCILVWKKERVMSPVVNEFIRQFQTAFPA